MEKKTLKLDLDHRYQEISDQSYSFEKMEFAHAQVPKNGVVRVATQFGACREVVCSVVRDQMVGSAMPWSTRKIPLDKARLILYYRFGGKKVNRAVSTKGFGDIVAAGIRVVNAYEKELGWPLTKVYKLDCVQKVDNRHIFFYVVGSKRWIKAPAMLSLYTLLIRLGHLKVCRKRLFRTYKSVHKALKDASKTAGGVSADLSYFRTYNKKWIVILKNYNKLFKDRTVNDLYLPSQKQNDNYFSEGINTLCDHDSLDVKLRLGMDKIYKEMEK